MSHDDATEFRVLHALRIVGLQDTAGVAKAAELGEDDAGGVLGELERLGLAERRTGRISGWRLTGGGRERHADLLQLDAARHNGRPVIEAFDASFIVLNPELKEICTAWQLRPGPDGEPIANDHSDAAYDTAITNRLVTLHADVMQALDGLCAGVPRFEVYRRGLDEARGRFVSGDGAALARPLTSSYHDHWMHLHEDLLVSLGRARTEADGH